MIDPLVRPAVPSDAGELIELEAAARAALIDQRGGARWLEEHPSHGDWQRTIDDAVVFVGVLDDVVMGYLVMTYEVVEYDVRAGHAPAVIAHVESVYVRPEARELGYGDELLAAALAAARSDGASVLEAEALPGDRQTKNLYERAKITARSITVSTVL